MQKMIARAVVVAVLACGALLAASPAYAADDEPLGSKGTKKELEERGYDCGRMGIGGFQCTKDGEDDWYCDNSGDCVRVPEPFTRPTGGPLEVDRSPTRAVFEQPGATGPTHHTLRAVGGGLWLREPVP